MVRFTEIFIISLLVSAPPAFALQGLDVPESRTFDDRLPRDNETGDLLEFEYEKKLTIEREISNLVICSEGAASGEDLNAALVSCDSAISEEPERGDAYYYRGFVNFHLERFAEAERDFSSAIDFATSRAAESYFQRGVCKERQRRLREAARDFEKAAQLKPDWSAARRKVEEYHWAYE